MNSASLQRLILETHLRKAFEKDEFFLHYQPKIDCVTNRIIGLEALVRWNNPELGLVSPGSFIPLAEDTGLIISLDRWVLATVCHQLEEWRAAGIPLPRVAVNLSARHFLQRNLSETMRQIASRGPAARDHLELEITEGVLMDSAEEVVETLELLQESGVRIAIDDFGTGYSSLSYLTRLPFHTLKIDRAFVSQIGETRESASVVTAIIALAKSLGKEVVAEGVETVEQLRFLLLNDCRLIQGYLFSRPLPEDQIRDLLRLGEAVSAFLPEDGIRDIEFQEGRIPAPQPAREQGR